MHIGANMLLVAISEDRDTTILCEYLINLGIDVNVVDINGWCPLTRLNKVLWNTDRVRTTIESQN